MSQVPSQHYLFAHRLLPGLLWQGDSMLGILVNPENQPFLGEQWDTVRSRAQCVPSTGRERLAYSTHWIGDDNLAVVITLPPPAEICDAHLVAITTSPVVRYLTLELGENDLGRRHTVLGEWTPNGHANFGDGPAPIPDHFLQAVCRILGLPPSVEDTTLAQRQGMSRGGSVFMGSPMDPADLADLKKRQDEAESLEWDSQHAPAFDRYHAMLQDFLARYAEPPTEVTLLYGGAVRCLKSMGHLEMAETWARQWWNTVRRFRMLGHAEAMMASRMVAEVVAAQGRRGEAEALYDHRVQLAGLARGVGSPQHQGAMKDLEAFAQP
jgi:hypothetical protein